MGPWLGLSAGAALRLVLPAALVGAACGARSELELPWSYGGGGTSVTRFDPENQSTSVVAHTGQTVVGAGVSTCAPMSQ